MPDEQTNPFTLARELAPQFEEILNVNNLTEQIEALDENFSRVASLQPRDFVLGDGLSMAGLFVSLVSLLLQVRKGYTYQNESTEKIAERLILKLSEETSLPPATRERLINELIKKLGVVGKDT